MADDGKQSPSPQPGPFGAFLNPVVALAWIILLSVLFLILCAMFGLDKGVLASMSKTEYARGLITYLFAVVTIGTAVVLVVSALTSPPDEQHKEQFNRGKEVLSLLLGVFGTIVGFYFGAEVAKGTEEAIRIAPIHLSSDVIAAKTTFKLTAAVSGGQPPYQFGAGIDKAPEEITEPVGEGGWIEKELTAPPSADNKERTVQLELRVSDTHGHTGRQTTKITIKPSP